MIDGLRGRAMSFLQRFLPPYQYWGYGSTPPNNYDRLGKHAFEKSIIVAQAVNRIMSTTGMAIPIIKELQGDHYVEVNPSHPLLRLLNYPAPKTSRFTLFSHTVGRLLLEGNCFWALTGSQGIPEQIKIIPTRFMEIHPNPDNGEVMKYVYRPHTGAGIDLSPESVIHITRFHPNNEYWGLSVLSSAMIEVDGDYAMAQWNQGFFGPRNAIPNMAVEVQGMINDNDFQKMKQDWFNRGGMARETIFFRTGGGANPVKLHSIGLTPMEAHFLDGRRFNRKAIFDLFGVHEAMFDKDATEASSITGERNYYQMVYELLMMLGQHLSLELAPFFIRGGQRGDLEISFRDIRPVNEELKLKQIETAAKFKSINEIRKEYYDMPDEVEWGNGPAQGSGSAYIQFMGGMNPAAATPLDVYNHGGQRQQDEQAARQEQTNPLLERRNPQTRGLEKALVVQAQRQVISALRGGDVTGANLAMLPDGLAEQIKGVLPYVTTQEDVTTLFDPLFEEARWTPLKAEQAADEWTVRQIVKLPAANRISVQEAVNDIRDSFGFSERIIRFSDVPADVWDEQPSLAASL